MTQPDVNAAGAVTNHRRALLAGAGLGLGALAASVASPAQAAPPPRKIKNDLVVDGDLAVAGDLTVRGPRPWIDVTAYGAVGDAESDDTAAFRAAVSALPATGGTLFVPTGNYLINGTIKFEGLSGLTVFGLGARLTQRATYTATFEFRSVEDLRVHDLEFVGVGTEHDGTSTRFNGVAGIYLFDATEVRIHDCRFLGHAGGGLRWGGALERAWFERNTIVGIGAPTIGPLDNNSDFAIGGYAATKNVDITVRDNEISQTCFGIGVSGGHRVTITGNRIHDLPGQHGLYLSATSQVVVSNNQIHNTYGLGIKNQVAETYPGDVQDNVISGNVITGTQTAIVIATTSGVASKRHLTTILISNNIIRASRESGIYHTAGIDSRIADNDIDNVAYYGMYLKYFSGEACGNTIRRTGYTAIWAAVDDTSIFRNNLFLDAAIAPRTNPGDTGRTEWSHHVFVSNSGHARVTEPLVIFDGNVHSAPAGDPATVTSLVRVGTGLGLIWTDVVNLTTKSLRCDAPDSVKYTDVRYSPRSTVAVESDPSHVVAGIGHREFHAPASPDAAGASGAHGVGDVCWNSKPSPTGAIGWVCLEAGTPGVWRAFPG